MMLTDTTLFGYTVSVAFPNERVAVDYIKFAERSEQSVGKTYLLRQLEKFEQQGWKLLQIFEDEQAKASHIVESRILHALGISPRTVYARKCEVHFDLPLEQTRDFLDRNHIQGVGRGANLYAALTHGSEIVAVMSLGRARFNKNVDFELIRFATASGMSVVGAASRLLKHVLQETGDASIISYADRRYSTGDLYRSLGFQEQQRSAPCYWYFHPSDPLKKYHRSSFQKHKLPDKLEIFDPQLSETENMFKNGWNRIYDSGNYVFILDPKATPAYK